MNLRTVSKVENGTILMDTKNRACKKSFKRC